MTGPFLLVIAAGPLVNRYLIFMSGLVLDALTCLDQVFYRFRRIQPCSRKKMLPL